MSKSITLSEKQWSNLKRRLLEDHPPSVILIRDKMRRVLGFTCRMHAVCNYSESYYIHLDFFSEPKRTFFLLKYGEYLNEHQKTSS